MFTSRISVGLVLCKSLLNNWIVNKSLLNDLKSQFTLHVVIWIRIFWFCAIDFFLARTVFFLCSLHCVESLDLCDSYLKNCLILSEFIITGLIISNPRSLVNWAGFFHFKLHVTFTTLDFNRSPIRVGHLDSDNFNWSRFQMQPTLLAVQLESYRLLRIRALSQILTCVADL